MLDNDLTVIGQLEDTLPAQRFTWLLEIISNIPRDKETEKRLSLYLGMDTEDITKHFIKKRHSKVSD
jgi:hypothetical protein